jgi:hypothetical protein
LILSKTIKKKKQKRKGKEKKIEEGRTRIIINNHEDMRLHRGTREHIREHEMPKKKEYSRGERTPRN